MKTRETTKCNFSNLRCSWLCNDNSCVITGYSLRSVSDHLCKFGVFQVFLRVPGVRTLDIIVAFNLQCSLRIKINDKNLHS